MEKERNETREEKKREVGALQARLVEKGSLRAILTEATKKAEETDDTEMSRTNPI